MSEQVSTTDLVSNPVLSKIPENATEFVAQASLRRHITRALQRDAKKARWFLRQVLDGKAFDPELRNHPAAVKMRMDAAHLLLDRAGYVPPKAIDPAGASMKDPSEMGSDELRAFLARAEHELGNRARLVDSAPVAPVPSTQLNDLLG